MAKIAIQLFWVVFLISLAGTGAKTRVEVTIVDFSNPSGTAYNVSKDGSDRKCCDIAGSQNCNAAQDTCDVYFIVCIGGTTPSGHCREGKIDIQDTVIENAPVTTNLHVTGQATLDIWPPHGMYGLSLLVGWQWSEEVVVEVYDRDAGQNAELIDWFRKPTNFRPAPNYLSSTNHIMRFYGHVAVGVQVRAWCDRGWYGPTCESLCQTDVFHDRCSDTGHALPAPQCTDPDMLVLEMRDSLTNITSTLDSQLFEYIADFMCDAATTRVEVTVAAIQTSSDRKKYQVLFKAKCDGVQLSRLKFAQVRNVQNVLQLNHLKPSATQVFGHPVTPPRITHTVDSTVRVVYMLRLVDVQFPGCADKGHVQPCQALIDICLVATNASARCLKPVRLDGSDGVVDCDGSLVDLQRSGQLITNTHNSTYLLEYNTSFSALIIKIAENVSGTERQIGEDTYDLGLVTVGTNYENAHPMTGTFNTTNNNYKVRVEVMRWCGYCYYGDQCQLIKPGCNTTTVTLPTDCIENNDCQNGGTCQYNVCDCKEGWVGRHCQVDMDECTQNVCVHKASCHNTVGAFTCSCSPGFKGHLCDQDIDECASSPCVGNSTCINEWGSYVCLCPSGRVGKHCEKTEYCPTACPSGESCFSEQTDVLCNCYPNRRIELCSRDILGCCCDRGRCGNSTGTYTCSCKAGWTGGHCETDIDECASYPCLHQGVCSNKPGGFRCTCPPGWTGELCQTDVNECDPSPCQNNGVCRNIEGGYFCDCNDRWEGLLCEKDVDECKRPTDVCQHGVSCNKTTGNPCVNGTCSNTQGGFSCACTPGWSGKTCNTYRTECSSNPCQHNGKCSSVNGSVVCECVDGWSGKICDEDIMECLAYPCGNNGTCTNKERGFICKCPEGWTGTRCQLDDDECLIEPCMNSGSCENTIGSFRCHCRSGYTGANCHLELNECVSDPCSHGNCANVPGGFVCSCDTGWTGANCEEDVDECREEPCDPETTCSNTRGGYSCLTSATTAVSTTPRFDGILLEFAGPISPDQLPQIRQGVLDMLQQTLCRNSSSVNVAILPDSTHDGNKVEFQSHCDGRHLTSQEVSQAITTVPAEKLDSLFPLRLVLHKDISDKQSWISSHGSVVGGVCAAVLACVVLSLVAVVIYRRRRAGSTGNQLVKAGSRDPGAGLALEEQGTLTIENPAYNRRLVYDK